MAHETIEFSIADGVATIALDRPDSLNSFNTVLHDELRGALNEVRDDAAVRAVLLTGNGRGFCAGQDLGDRAVDPSAAMPDLGESVQRYYNPLIRTLTGLEKPVICAVNGVAAGAGVSLALACDIVLAARSASFVLAFSKIGVIPDSGCTWHLPRSVGFARAMGLAMLGGRISAEQAAEWGMIWQVCDDDKLMAEAGELAANLATQPTRGLALIKQALRASLGNSLDEQLELEREYMRTAGRTRDYREGVTAFMAKRKPQFTGE